MLKGNHNHNDPLEHSLQPQPTAKHTLQLQEEPWKVDLKLGKLQRDYDLEREAKAQKLYEHLSTEEKYNLDQQFSNELTLRPQIVQFGQIELFRAMFYAKQLFANEETFEQWALKQGYVVQKEGKRFRA